MKTFNINTYTLENKAMETNSNDWVYNNIYNKIYNFIIF